MSQQTINIGTAPNDGTGTPLRTAFDYCNLNFTELYTAVGPSGNNIVCPGTLTVSAGTLALPSLTTAGDTNTGIYFPAADTIAFVEGGAEAMRINSTGNLVVNNAATITGALGAAGLNVTGATIPANGVYLGSANNLSFSANSALGMTLNSTGLGVGVTPATSSKIHTLGNGNNVYAIFQNGDTLAASKTCQLWLSNGPTFLGANNREYRIVNSGMSATAADLVFDYWNGTAIVERMRIDSAGNLLVGTVSPSSLIGGSGAITAKGIAGILSVNVTALSTNFTLPIGAFSGILVIRSNASGGSAVWMLDPNAGAVSISNNIVGRTLTFTFSGGAWQLQQTVGAVPSTYNYNVIATQ